ANPVTQPLLPAEKNFEAFGLVGCKARPRAGKPASTPAASRLPQTSDIAWICRLKPPPTPLMRGRLLVRNHQQLYVAEQRRIAASPPASSSTNSPSSASSKSACGILDLSLKRLADAASPMSQKKKPQQQQQGQQAPKQQQQKTIAKPQRQNFTDVQNSQLQGLVLRAPAEAVPQHPRTRTGCRSHRPEATDAGNPQQRSVIRQGLPSNWSLAEFRSENSPA
uniref:CG10617 n=1 Tax=Macrostomum lignano TaxID=282301 RepID=A0A1I8FEL8_9PLAT